MFQRICQTGDKLWIKDVLLEMMEFTHNQPPRSTQPSTLCGTVINGDGACRYCSCL